MNEQLPSHELRLWRTFLSVNVRMMEHLDQNLQKTSSLSLTDYEILYALSQADQRRLRMSELADQVLVSRSRLTYRVDRLGQVDFVGREECDDDRRGLWAILTETGQLAFESARQAHYAEIRKLFLDPQITDGPAFEAVLKRIEEGLQIRH